VPLLCAAGVQFVVFGHDEEKGDADQIWPSRIDPRIDPRPLFPPHRGALKAGGRTLAVLAGGLSRIYPPEHQDLALEVQAVGALISKASIAMQPLAALFPNRKRLISGLSLGVVVVEAAEKSGALITASRAGDQGRTVFAVPGPVDSAASGGTTDLIRKCERQKMPYPEPNSIESRYG
jgi:DNA protecting protein DprA